MDEGTLRFGREEGKLVLLGEPIPEVWIAQALLVDWTSGEAISEVEVADGIITIKPYNAPELRYQIVYWEPQARAWRARLIEE